MIYAHHPPEYGGVQGVGAHKKAAVFHPENPGNFLFIPLKRGIHRDIRPPVPAKDGNLVPPPGQVFCQFGAADGRHLADGAEVLSNIQNFHVDWLPLLFKIIFAHFSRQASHDKCFFKIS